MIGQVGNRVGSERGAEVQELGVPSDRPKSRGPLVVGNGTLHHLGYVVTSISKVAEDFATSMGLEWDGKIIHDPLQRVRVSFFRPLVAQNPVYELVEPAGETSPVTRFLKKGGGFHHVCYEVDNLESALREARATGLAIVSPATPAVAFDGRKIAWVCSRNRLLMEFLERC